MKKQLIFIGTFSIMFSCSYQQEEPNQSLAFIPKIVEAKGYVAPNDSMAEPKVVIAGEPEIILAGKPEVVYVNNNVHAAGEPKVFLIGKPRVVTPGQDTFLLPKIVPAIDSPFLAGSPEVVMAKDAYNKDINPQNFSSFSKLQGLNDNTIRCLLADQLGNLWLGTAGGGVSKYDGKSFTHFTTKEGLSHNIIRCMLEDKSGNLWFGTNGGGVSKYDGKSFIHFTTKEGLSHNRVYSVFQDKKGNFWFGTYGGGVSKYDGKSFTHFTTKEGLSNNIVYSIIQDKKGNLWFGTYGGGISKYDGKSFTHYTEKEGLGSNYVFSILQDKSGNLWIGTRGGGVSKYDGKSFANFTEKEGLSNNNVYCMIQEKKGNIWFGTYGGGISKYDGKSFTHYTEKEGISNNYILSVLQDKSGNLWFGTDGGGLLKFAGKIFTHYTEKEGLSNNLVLSILQDKIGNLWFGTNGGGVSKYDGNRVEAIERGEKIPPEDQQDLKKVNGKLVKSFTHFTEKEGLSNNTVLSIIQDKNGHIWFGTYGGGVSKYDGKSFTHFTEKEGLSNNFIRSILQDKSGNLWFGTVGGGVSKYDGNRVEAIERGEKIPPEDQQDFKKVNGKLVKSFTHFTEKEGLSNNYIFSILQDKSGNLWFGTDGGGVSKYDGDRVEAIQRGEKIPPEDQQDLKKVNGKLVKSFTHFTEKEGLSNNTVLSIIQDKNGHIWFGTYGGGVSKYDGKSFTHFTEKEGLSNNFIRSILQDKSGNLWFGTVGGGVSKYDGDRVEAIQRGEKIPPEDQQDLKKVNGKLVKSFTSFTKKEGLSNNTVLSILQDKSRNLWFGTVGGGVSKYDGNRVEAIQRGEKIPPEDQQDLKKVNGKLVKSFTHFTEKEGLSNNMVLSILQDKSGNLWFGTRLGLSKLTQESMAKYYPSPYEVMVDNANKSNTRQSALLKNYTYEDGFLGIGCNRGAICEDKNGIIWIGANQKLTAYHPKGDETDTIPPNVQLTGIELFNENIDWVNFEQKRDTKIILGNGVAVENFNFEGTTRWYGLPVNLSLKYNNNFLVFKYIGITLKQSKKVKYQYKLEGLDENWSAPTFRNEASYGNLSHGTYTFRVKAMNSEGYWSNEHAYTFTIRPPWWKTWWFRILMAIFAITSLIGFFRWRMATLKKQKKQLELTVKEKTAEIVQQKEELQTTNEELYLQNDEIQTQYEEVLKQRKKNESQALKLQIQNTKLQEQDEFKQGLTSMIVHDLKNPLNLILNVSQSFSPKKQLSIIQQSSKQLLNMVLNILDVHKYEDMSMAHDLEEKQVALIAINAIKQVQYLSEQKEITIKNQIEQTVFAKVDEEIVERIFVNLLTNAIKYTPLNGSIALSSNQISKAIVRIEVKDTGEGIPKDKLHLVFQKFGQIAAKKSGIVRSTGLGLTFCKLAVEAHGGEIGLDSEKGKGTTFWFTLKVGTFKNGITEIIEKEIAIEDEIIFTDDEKAILKPIINQLNAFTIYEIDDIGDIIEQIKPIASKNIQRWMVQIEKHLVTLNQERYLELLKMDE